MKIQIHVLVNNLVDICGDGYKTGLAECDDGNTIDGDGCSSDCKIEIGWNCSSQSTTICRNTIQPTFRVYMQNHDTEIVLQFSKRVSILQSQTLQEIFSINATSPLLSNCLFTIQSNQSSTIGYITRIHLNVVPGCFLNGSEVIFL